VQGGRNETKAPESAQVESQTKNIIKVDKRRRNQKKKKSIVRRVLHEDRSSIAQGLYCLQRCDIDQLAQKKEDLERGGG
jgi:hypothetical protein